MKRMILYGLITLAALLVPMQRQDIATLEPIQAVYLDREGTQLILRTDTDDQGAGESAEKALNVMKYESAGIVYLDTAQFLLVSENALEDVAQMIPLLKGSVKVCRWDGEGDLTEAAAYLQAHKIGCRLDQWNMDVRLPKIPSPNPSK